MARHFSVSDEAPGFFRSVLKPLIFSLVLTALSLCLLAALIVYGPVTEAAATICMRISTAICMLLSGFLSARRRTSRGYAWGGLCGLLYVVAAYFVSALGFGDFSIGAGSFELALWGICLGAVGGILGVNIRPRR